MVYNPELGDSMKVARLSISGYRNLGDAVIDFDDDLTVLVGKNDSGKSNVVKAIEFVLGILKMNLERQVQYKRYSGDIKDEWVIEDSTDHRILAQDRDGEIRATLTVRLTEVEVKRGLSTLKNPDMEWSIHPPSDFSVMSFHIHSVGESVGQDIRLRFRIVRIDCESGIDIMTRDNGGCTCISGADNGALTYSSTVDCLPWLIDVVCGSVHQNVSTLRIIPAERTISGIDKGDVESGYGLRDPSDPRIFVRSLDAHQKDAKKAKQGVLESLHADLHALFPEYEGFRIMSEGEEGRLEVFFKKFPSTQVGSGVKQTVECFRVIRLSTFAPMYVVEEPEIHLHPRKQRDFYRYLREQLARRQLIVTTHSPTIVAESPIESIRVVRNLGGMAVVQSVKTPEELKHVAGELGVMPRDVFESELFIIVEDESSRNYLLRAMNVLGTGSGRVSVIDVGGWGNTGAWANSIILRELDRPFIVVFDGDVKTVPKRQKEMEKYLERVRIDPGRIVYLEQSNIEHYIANPRAIVAAFPGLDEARVLTVLGDVPSKRDLKDEFRQIFLETYERGFSNDDAAKIIEKLGTDDFPEEIARLFEKVDMIAGK